MLRGGSQGGLKDALQWVTKWAKMGRVLANAGLFSNGIVGRLKLFHGCPKGGAYFLAIFFNGQEASDQKVAKKKKGCSASPRLGDQIRS